MDKDFYLNIWKSKYFVMAVTASLGEGAIRINLAFLGGKLVNAIIIGKTEEFKQTFGMIFIGSVCIMTCIWMKERLYAIALEKEIVKLKKSCFDKLSGASMHYLNEHHHRELSASCLNDINSLSKSLRPFVVMCFSLILQRVETVLYMLSRNWVITIVMISLSPVLLWIQGCILKPVKDYQKKNLCIFGKMLGIVTDCFKSVEFIKAFSLENEMLCRIKEKQEEQIKVALRSKILEASQSAFSYLSEILPRVLLIMVSSYEIMQGRMTVGEMMFFISLSSSASRLFSGFAEFSRHIHHVNACLERVKLDDMELEEELYLQKIWNENCIDSSVGRDTGYETAIELKNVTFGYESQTMVLQNLSFTVRKGEWVRLTGESGCGKSTVFQLICGFFSPQAGEIWIGDENYGKIGVYEARKKISYIPQLPYLFPTSVYENIAGCGIKISKKEVKKILYQLGMEEWLDGLPQGLDTRLDGHEIQLSGGQRQRIAIARGMAKKSQVLLMDEITAGLDSHSEEKVYQTLRKSLKNYTVIIVTHNAYVLSDVRDIYIGKAESK